MSRITLNSKCRLCRAAGSKLYLKGVRCTSSKCPIEKKGAVPPGMHGIKSSKKPTDYGIQLKAKQRAKRLYGVAETQFKNYYLKAKKLKGLVGDNLLSFLERRLDSVVYRLGLGKSRSAAKQLVSHRHILVNDAPLSISSYLVKVGDVIKVDATVTPEYDANLQVPGWIDLNKQNNTAKILSLPGQDDISGNGIDINLIIEYYSR